jgi:F-type H+-transporting ATPase subunit epsilon
MQFDLVSPERSLASLQVRSVLVPGSDGDMTVMPDHAPVMTTLRPGLLRVEAQDGNSEYLVSGGFAEITLAGLSVLAEKAIPLTEVTRAHLDQMIADARAAHDTAKDTQKDHPGLVDNAAKLLADMEALGDHITV